MSNRRIGSRTEALLAVIILVFTAVSLAEDSQMTNVSKGKLLYEDDFSTSKVGIWPGAIEANISYYYQNGSYEMVVNPMNYWSPLAAGNEYGDIILEVEATQKAGPNDNVYGVIVRKVDWSNYYNFLISGDGYYEIAKYENDTWSPSSWNKTSAIKIGKATNLIRVVCNGDKFSFYVNDVLLQEYTDSSFPSGDIGLEAGTNYAPGAVTVDFDNLKIWEIKR